MDKELIIKRLEYIKEKLKDLKYDLNKYEETKILRDKKSFKGAIERWSEEIVESAVNINNEILSIKNKVSSSYYNSFIDLEEFNIFEKKFLEKIASTAGFRNRLAHDYMNINEDIVISSSKFLLKLYKDYIIGIYEFLEK